MRRMPAESEALGRVFVASPKRAKSWPGCLAEAQRQHARLVRALENVVEVVELGAAGIAYGDSWLRDTGPVFVEVWETDAEGLSMRSVRAIDFPFNHWGGKYAGHEVDDAVASAVARHAGVGCERAPIVAEGGGLESDGEGTLLVVEGTVLGDGRNPGQTRETLADAFRQLLGARGVVYLPRGLHGDETDGHVDNVARFLRSGVVAHVAPPAGHVDHRACAENMATLREQGMEVVELPAVEPGLVYGYPDDPALSDGLTGEQALTASYANWVVANGVCFLPAYGRPTDARAAAVVREASGWDVELVEADALLVGGGSLHCLTCGVPGDLPENSGESL